MVVCSLCKHDGHLKKDCPEDFKKVELDLLPALTPEFLGVLNKVCEQCYSEYHFMKLSVSTLPKAHVSLLLFLLLALHSIGAFDPFAFYLLFFKVCVTVALFPL